MKTGNLARAIMVFGTLAPLCACQQNTDPGPVDEQTAPLVGQTVTATGTLEGGIVAIGGETTGWLLRGTERFGDIMIEPAQVQQPAQQLEGRRVNVTGRLAVRDYVERGPTQVILAERIEPAP